jgi:hypothetical protein
MAAAKNRGGRFVPMLRWHKERSCPQLHGLEGTMGADRNLLRLLLALLLTAMFASSVFANEAASRSQAYPLRITVVSSETHALNGGTPVPKDCDLTNYSAYCNESTNPTAQSILVVQGADGKTFRITCTTDSRWSKCSPLPVGQTFDARQEKHGITIVSWNAKGREIKQHYELVAVVKSSAAAPPLQNSPVPMTAPPAVVPVQSSQVAPLAPRPVSTQEALPGKVKCNFNSTPPGAEITIDWRFVGNTPSEIGLSPGTHVVVISMEGFAEWKRELTVAADSVVNVTANLQRTQP